MSASLWDRIEQAPAEVLVQQKGRIIVVEPNDLILRLLERWLGEAGYVVVAGTLQSLARAVVEGEKPDLVIIDVATPRRAEKVINFVREVHASPILLLSTRFTRGMGSSMSVARELGVRHVLPKPFSRGELLSAVSESIDRQ